MLSDFHAYLDSFCAATQQSWQKGKESPHAILALHGFPLNLYYLENRSLLFIQAGVGVPPEDSASREMFWKKLLKANNAFSETGGATLGYDQESNMVTLQVAWPLDGLAQDSFNNLLENTVGLLAQWLQELSQWEHSANGVGTPIGEQANELLQYHNLLRI